MAVVPFCGSGFAFATDLTAPRRGWFGSSSFPTAFCSVSNASISWARSDGPSCGLAVVVAALVKPARASPLGGDEAIQGFLHSDGRQLDSDGRHLGLELDLSVAPVLKR